MLVMFRIQLAFVYPMMSSESGDWLHIFCPLNLQMVSVVVIVPLPHLLKLYNYGGSYLRKSYSKEEMLLK
jgi:hypothetical protein